MSSRFNMPLPIPREVHALAALHCKRRYAAHLIAIRDARHPRDGTRGPGSASRYSLC
jgi:hypothetical protein